MNNHTTFTAFTSMVTCKLLSILPEELSPENIKRVTDSIYLETQNTLAASWTFITLYIVPAVLFALVIFCLHYALKGWHVKLKEEVEGWLEVFVGMVNFFLMSVPLFINLIAFVGDMFCKFCEILKIPGV